MSMTTPRQRLGAELTRIRTLAGIPQRAVAKELDVSLRTVQRMEQGTSVPSWPETERWARACAAAQPDMAGLRILTEAALNEVTPFRDRLQDGGLAAIQKDVARRAAETRLIRNFQSSIIPGLLQHPEYARRVLQMRDYTGTSDIPAAVAARIDRQQILFEEGHHFEFVLTEGALRWRPGPAAVLRAQLAQLITTATADLPTVKFGVVPFTAEMRAVPFPFSIYENQDGTSFAVTEAPHGEVRASKPADVEIYRQQWDLLTESALHGTLAVELVSHVLREISREALLQVPVAAHQQAGGGPERVPGGHPPIV
jgi:transcriptional regulator with XRE-family HTH domain